MNSRQTIPASLSATLVFIGIVCIAWIAFDSPQIYLATNSDTLLPSSWAQLVLREHYPFGSFQLPQTTSLFPDLLLHAALQLATGSWRMASVLYGGAQMLAMVVAASLIAHAISGAPRLLAAAVFLCLAAGLLALDAAPGRDNITRLRIVVEITAHGGGFLLSLFGALLICHMLQAARSMTAWLLLFGLSAVCYLSDQLTVFELHLPALMALLWLRRETAHGTWRRVATPLLLGAAAGQVGLELLNREHGIYLMLHPLRLIADSSGMVVVLWYLPALLVPGLALLPPTLFARIAPSARTLPARFLWRFGLLAIVLTVGAVALLLYVDDGGFRYFYALAWWPVILATALLAPPLARWRLAAPLVAGAALLLLVPRLPHHPPRLLSWGSPIADCLRDHRRTDGLTAGLAAYWLARQTEAAMDWTIEVEQIKPDGSRLDWGNDARRYAAPHGFDFIVMPDLDADRIVAAYGRPSTVLQCPGAAVWVYPQDIPIFPRATSHAGE